MDIIIGRIRYKLGTHEGQIHQINGGSTFTKQIVYFSGQKWQRGDFIEIAILFYWLHSIKFIEFHQCERKMLEIRFIVEVISDKTIMKGYFLEITRKEVGKFVHNCLER